MALVPKLLLGNVPAGSSASRVRVVKKSFQKGVPKQSPMPRNGTLNDENRVSGRYTRGSQPDGSQDDAQWCIKPDKQSVPDVDAYPKLLLLDRRGSTRSRLLPPSMSSVGAAREITTMEFVYQSVAGLDVHQKTVVACVRRLLPQGDVHEEVRTFGTMTRDLLALSDWLAAEGVTHVAMESTGVLWKPVWNILEGADRAMLLVNPRELKQVPGRKSDVRDCQWIAHLLQCGLLKSSFVAPPPLRELRDLTRHRAQLLSEQSRVANRIHKILEDANIKLGAVASDILGKSGRAMLEALLAGERDPEKLAELAEGRMRSKIPMLQQALAGRFSGHHEFVLRNLLDHLDYLGRQIGVFSERIEVSLDPFVNEAQRDVLDAIPGVNRRTIENVVAEIGSDMSRFPDDDHLSSWAGMSPGHEESAGKRSRSRTTKGNRWLRRALNEAAWAASRCKDSYLSAQYRRLAARRGKKRAAIAVGHSILVIIYHLLKHGGEYRDLGPNFFDQLEPERYRRYLVKRLQRLGYDVVLTPTNAA
jgi:transposase